MSGTGKVSTSVAVAVKANKACSSTDFSPITPNAGASLTGVTVIVTVAVFESTTPSFTLNVKLSGPL